MQPRATLINTARAIVDEAAVIDALTNGHLSHAWLDVFQTEPLPANHPLTKVVDVTSSPHSTFRTKEAPIGGMGFPNFTSSGASRRLGADERSVPWWICSNFRSTSKAIVFSPRSSG